MNKIISKGSKINKTYKTKKEAISLFEKEKENYKIEIIQDSEQENDFQIYKQDETSDDFKLSGSKIFEEQGKDYVYIDYDINNNNQVSDDNCFFRYTQAQSETIPPAYDIIDDGC